MKQINICFLILLLAGFVILSSNQVKVKNSTKEGLYYLTQQKQEDPMFALGRDLFYMTDLSLQRNTSCASCHLQTTGFAHVDHNLSHGSRGIFGIRNAPGLWNLEKRKVFMHDGRIVNLRDLAIHPLTDSLEMDMNFEEMIVRLEYYYNMDEKFNKAFGTKEINKDRILDALFAYVKELKSTDSKFDKVKRKEKGYQFTADEQKGYDLFKKQCMSCHSGLNFSNQKFESNGIAFDYALYDLGRMRVTGLQKDSFKFLVPSLRNIAVTFPYMHDGRFQTIDEVLEHYQTLENTTTDNRLSNIRFTKQEGQQLKQFLLTLTDTSFLTNPRLGFPPNDF